MNPSSTRPLQRLRVPLVALASLLLGACQATLFAGLNAVTTGRDVAATRDVTYDGAHGLKLDVFRPRDAHAAPTVVFFYGGAWKSGKRQWYRWVGEQLARRGMVVVIPDYRLWPKVKLDGFMSDAAHAVAWARAHAADYGGDPKRLFVMGHSAGAHLAVLLASDAHWLQAEGMQPRQLAGAIGLAGPYDFLPLQDPDYVDMFGPTHAAQLRSQPVHYVDGDEPPMLLLQGTTDAIVWPRNAESMARRLREHGEPVQMRLYPGIGHFAILFALSQPFHSKAPVLEDVTGFVMHAAPAGATPAPMP